jgi:hypothetical protein
MRKNSLSLRASPSCYVGGLALRGFTYWPGSVEGFGRAKVCISRQSHHPCRSLTTTTTSIFISMSIIHVHVHLHVAPSASPAAKAIMRSTVHQHPKLMPFAGKISQPIATWTRIVSAVRSIKSQALEAIRCIIIPGLFRRAPCCVS